MLKYLRFYTTFIIIWLALQISASAQRKFPDQPPKEKTNTRIKSSSANKKTLSSWDRSMIAALQASHQGDYQQAETLYLKALEQANNNKQRFESTQLALIELYGTVAAQKASNEDYDAAIDYYQRILSYHPADDMRYRNHLSAVLINRGSARIYQQSDYEGAISDYTAAIEMTPDNALAYRFRGIARVSRKEIDKAISDYQIAKRVDEKNQTIYDRLIVDALLIKGNSRAEQGDYPGAIKEFEQAQRLLPDNPQIYANCASARSSAGDYYGAISDYQRLMELEPKDQSIIKDKIIAIYLVAGSAKAGEGDYPSAIAAIEKALKLAPENVTLRKRLAALYQDLGSLKADQGDYRAAQEALHSALQFDLDNALIYFSLGSVMLRVTNYQAAVENFTHAIEIDKEFAAAYLKRATAYQRLGLVREAQQDLEQAKKLDTSINK